MNRRRGIAVAVRCDGNLGFGARRKPLLAWPFFQPPPAMGGFFIATSLAIFSKGNPMAFSGLHVVCGFAGSQSQRYTSQAILGKVVWSEAPATGVTSTNAAPSPSDIAGDALFRINAAADSWVAVGKTPDATAGTRFLVRAGADYDIYAQQGDKFQWVAA
ncbi:hypothetical protein RHECIAT_CH0003090 [Rhizobium etli CIAT 652]|uniref:Uncharacterized protein n=1 Tax=Rhizobium etli (strain CIAT 652) TaxID=491916 RepID=B3PUF7_RHIE6|nr:hypothetical protein RHECIAT_CH0003090 [Rhizobium etli CIAT 652]